MDRLIPTTVLIAGLILLFWLMRRSWQRQAAVSVPDLTAVPTGADAGPARPATYVVTTRLGEPVNRLAAHTLGERSAADVYVTDAGVLVARQGAEDIYIPRRELRQVRRGAGMIGKTVGGEGLVILEWTLQGVELESGLRFRHRADAEAFVVETGHGNHHDEPHEVNND